MTVDGRKYKGAGVSARSNAVLASAADFASGLNGAASTPRAQAIDRHGWEVAANLAVSDCFNGHDYARVFAALAAETEATTGSAGHGFLVVALRDASQAVHGGLWAVISYGWLQITMLFVPPELRGRGVGRRLVRIAEAEALDRGCAAAQVDGFAFQAAGFYVRLGYEPFGVQENYPPGSSRVFFRKTL